jgi:hypothetical protein
MYNQFIEKFRIRKVPKREAIPVTVCVAAMCWDSTCIIGASDRMLTSSDIQFEPNQTKIVELTSSIAVMFAGDSFMQSAILHQLRLDINRRVDSKPTVWLNVKDVAELYSQYYSEARASMAGKAWLLPLGLNLQTFVDNQKKMDSALVRQIAMEILNYTAPSVEAIFTGIDNSGAHIYAVNNEDVTSRDFAGFAAIGVGAWHANSQLMFAGHTKWKPFPETLFLVYNAKKRAEVAPGVGSYTDMITIGPGLGSYSPIAENHITKLEGIYSRCQKTGQQANTKAIESTTHYVEEIIRATTQKEQAAIASDSGGDPPPDKKEIAAVPESYNQGLEQAKPQ